MGWNCSLEGQSFITETKTPPGQACMDFFFFFVIRDKQISNFKITNDLFIKNCHNKCFKINRNILEKLSMSQKTTGGNLAQIIPRKTRKKIIHAFKG